MNWTSIDKGLPKRTGRFLTYCQIEGQSLVAILWYEKDGRGFEKEVTHWMPLPEPPVVPLGSSCDGCFHNCGTWCDFESHCLKRFGETDAETDKRLDKENS